MARNCICLLLFFEITFRNCDWLFPTVRNVCDEIHKKATTKRTEITVIFRPIFVHLFRDAPKTIIVWITKKIKFRFRRSLIEKYQFRIPKLVVNDKLITLNREILVMTSKEPRNNIFFKKIHLPEFIHRMNGFESKM